METEAGMVDCGVGTIVWVRRRNGSWWPGKILGPDELSASHVMSPRSGTPVKLLGREDASVDWYNLEKSKRVKPFRCGEFDDCIERAEASQGMPPKKREKYARREDAILHALELEKQLVEKKYGKLRVDGDDKSPDLRPRLRGLQDLGPNPIPSLKYKGSSTNGSHKHVSDGEGSLLEKRKWSESQEGNMEETMNKRRRPLVQVLKSSAKLQAHIQHPSLQLQGQDQGDDPDPGMAGDSFETVPLPEQLENITPKFEKRHFDSFPTGAGLSEENNSSGSNEDTETDSSGTESLISDTYDATSGVEFIRKAFGRSESMSDDESGRVSKWQVKGKRNRRKYQERKAIKNLSFKEEEEEGYMSLSRMMLIDVDVQVQSGYQREHVPMISLMSKLNDKAIVGHPLPIETLASDIILSHQTKSRRLEQIDDDDDDKPLHLTSSCTQKTRTLSSLPHHHQSLDVKKPEPTAVACIPVKLVFSRLHEELVARHQYILLGM